MSALALPCTLAAPWSLCSPLLAGVSLQTCLPPFKPLQLPATAIQCDKPACPLACPPARPGAARPAGQEPRGAERGDAGGHPGAVARGGGAGHGVPGVRGDAGRHQPRAGPAIQIGAGRRRLQQRGSSALEMGGQQGGLLLGGLLFPAPCAGGGGATARARARDFLVLLNFFLLGFATWITNLELQRLGKKGRLYL